MTVPGVARHVPRTQPHTSGDLGGEGEGGEKTHHTHERAHCSRGTHRRTALVGAQAIHALSHADSLSSTQQLAWWRVRGEGLRRSRGAITYSRNTDSDTHARDAHGSPSRANRVTNATHPYAVGRSNASSLHFLHRRNA